MAADGTTDDVARAPGLRWGILGTGGIARAFTTDLANLPTHEVVAVGSRTVDGAREFGERFGIPKRHGSHEALVADPDIDAVYVATPHPAHARAALAAIEQGKHVLVEKAFTLNAHEAHAVADAARAQGVVVLEAMWTRFLPHTLRIRELLAAGAVGEVRTVVADHGQWFAHDPAHRLFDPGLGGGALLDLGVYPVSWAHMVLGTPSRITAVADPASTGVDAQTSVVLQYPGGAHAVLTSTLEALTPRRAWIAGTEGVIEVDPTFYALTSFTLTRRDGHVERFETPADVVGRREDGWGKGLRFEAAELARCVAEGLAESPHLPLAETVSIMETMDEIRRQSGIVYPGESTAGTTRPVTEPAAAVVGLRHLGPSGCVTFAAGADVGTALRTFRADTATSLTPAQAARAGAETVCVVAVPGGVLVAEQGGYQGTRIEVLRGLGDGRVASVLWTETDDERLTLVDDGAVASAEPVPLAEALIRAADWTGLPADARFGADVVVHPVLPVPEEFRPGSVEHTTLHWSHPDLVARVVAAPPAVQRAIAECCADDLLAVAGGDAAAAALKHAGWPVPVEAAIGALEQVVARGGPDEQRALREVRLLLDRPAG